MCHQDIYTKAKERIRSLLLIFLQILAKIGPKIESMAKLSLWSKYGSMEVWIFFVASFNKFCKTERGNFGRSGKENNSCRSKYVLFRQVVHSSSGTIVTSKNHIISLPCLYVFGPVCKTRRVLVKIAW